MLEVKNLRVHYGTVEAVQGVSFHVDAGEMISLIGANGAGKSTILRSLTGLVQPSAGDILFEGRSLVHLAPHQIIRLGATLESIYEHFPILQERSKQRAGSLSGGEQQMLATARALMNRPRLLLLDEPSIGLSPLMTAEIGKIVQQINAMGVSVILVEQNAMLALTIARRSYVLETGHIVMQGEAQELLQDEGVKKAYLGI
jgi:branched-chain amino acid transport system ATP-binding protein